MRSKLSIITMSWYNAVTIDLIRHAVRRDTFPSRGRLWLVRNFKFLPPLIRHGLRHATFPQGKADLRGASSPYTPGAFSLPQQRKNTGGGSSGVGAFSDITAAIA